MHRRHLLSLAIGVAIPAFAAADIGRPTSFSVTVSRAPGTINADLLVTTQNPVNPLTPDAVYLSLFVFRGNGLSPTFVASDSTTVERGLPTSNRQFAASFSITVPDEHQRFKVLAVAVPAGVQAPPGSIIPSSLISETLAFRYSDVPDLDVRFAPRPTEGPRVWFWAKGQQLLELPVPALSLWGLGALGLLLAAAGALLARRP
jgi:hypothetical protein